jgi:hypothetical protein
MADIDIVPKRRSSTWIWVLLALVVAAILVWLMLGRTDASASRSVVPDPAASHVTAMLGSLESDV